MSRILSKLPAWLGGTANTRADALTQLISQLAAHLGKETPGPMRVTLGRASWECAIFELGFPGGLTPLTELPKNLLAALPAPFELTFVTHTLPVEQVAEVAPNDDTVKGRLAHLLQPVPGRTSKRIRSYLFVRLAPQQSNWLSTVQEALSRVGTPATALHGEAAAALLHNWCGPLPTADASKAWASLVVTPAPRSRHPLQTLSFDSQPNVEAWEAVSLRSSEAGTGLMHPASCALFKGCEASVMMALSKNAEVYQCSGFSVVEMHRGLAHEHVVPRMPWQQPFTQRTPARRRKEPMLRPEEVASRLPLALTYPDAVTPQTQPLALATYNNLGAITHLRPQQQYGLSHTLVMGYAGSGLTYLGNALLAAHLRGGGQAWALRWQPAPIFDEVAQGHVVNPTIDCGVSLNPLSGMGTIQQFWQARPVLLSWLAMLANVERGTSRELGHEALNRYLLDRALDKAWNHAHAELGLGGVLAELDCFSPEAYRLSETIRAKLKGLPASWFEGDSSAADAANYVSVSPADLATPERELVAATVLALHFQAMVRRPRSVPKMLLIDEAGVLDQDGAQELLTLVLRSLRAENAVAVICEHPFCAEQAHQSPLERVLDEHCENKVFMSGANEHGWRERCRKMLGYEPRTPTGSPGKTSYFTWLQESHRGASLLELELCKEAQVAFAASPWQHAAYKEARMAGRPVGAALTHAAKVLSPYAKGPAA